MGTVMGNDLEALTADELNLLHLEVTAVLREKLLAKKKTLENRLQRLHPLDDHVGQASTSALSSRKSKTSEF